MYRIRAWGLSAALAVGAVAPIAFADDPAARPSETRPTDGKSYFSRMFGSSEKPPVEPPPAAAPTPPRPLNAGPLAPETLAEALRAEQDAYLRRLDVCTRLRLIASQSNDESLFEQADMLEQQATTLYHARVARFGVRGGPRGTGLPAAPVTAKVLPTTPSRSPEAVLDAKLGSGAATDPLSAAKPVSTTVPATAEANRFREVQP